MAAANEISIHAEGISMDAIHSGGFMGTGWQFYFVT